MLLMLPSATFAKKVSQAEAQRVAERFLGARMAGSARLRLLAIPQGLNIRNSPRQGYAPYYIYNAEGGRGFVIVSGDDDIADILAYSTEGAFSFDGAPDNIVAWMQFYADVMEGGSAKRTGGAAYANEPGTPVVSPLLGKIEWGQDAPFNGKCPTYTNADGKLTHYYVGCVATAMAQIMRFHKYPEHGTGTYTYQSNVGSLTADFGSTTYDWANMPERLGKDNANTAQNDAVATLSSHLGISVHMTYEPAGSGAFSQMVTGAMVKYFGYDKGMSYKVRDYYSTPEWMQMIKGELNAGRPVFYSASNEDGMGGHAFVCDGYDSNDFVHINWGWYGKSNGYFMVNAMNPYDLGIGANGGGYNLGQEIIVGIKPAMPTSKKGEWPVYGGVRFSMFPYGASEVLYQYMTYIENDDTEPFSGKIAAVLEKEGSIVKVLKESELSITGVDPARKNPVEAVQVTIKDVPAKVQGVADGQYRTMFAFKAGGDTEYTILRHPNGLPAYADVTVANGTMEATTHTPEPDVTLLEKITADGALYAKGSGAFRLNLRNNSNDFYLGKICLKFTSTDDPAKTYVTEEQDDVTNRVYDNSEKIVNLIVNLPEDMTPGMYEVTAFEARHEAHPFKDDVVGRAVMEVKKEATTPIIRQTSDYAWIGAATYAQDVKQGDKALVTQCVRNYGKEGSVGMLLKLEKADDAAVSYPFVMLDETFAKREARDLRYYNRIDVDPGQYKIKTYYLTENGENAVEGTFEDCIMEVKSNPDLVVECEEFTLPREMKGGDKVPFTVRLKANKDFKRNFYIRLRKLTGLGGEAVDIEFSLSMKAGETKTITKNYKPTVDDGSYMVLMETKKDQKTFETVGRHANYGGIYTIGEVSGISDINADGGGIEISFLDNGHAVMITRGGAGFSAPGIDVYTLSGSKAFSARRASGIIPLPLPGGVYVLRVNTGNGIVARKFVAR